MTTRRPLPVAVSLLLLAGLLAACGGSSKSGGPASVDPGNDPTTDPGNVPTITPPDPLHDTTTTLEVEGPVVTQWGPVSAPSLPDPAAVCTTLAAALSPVDGSIDPLDADSTASQPDRARLQAAIAACPAGQAVRLVTGPAGESGFLSGPLTLKSGVTLWVDAGVTLFASRNPADYDNGNGRCGTASTWSGKSCNPFITVSSSTTDVALVGDGIIDGRGGSLLTSGPSADPLHPKSWWDLAYETKIASVDQQCPRMIQVNGGKRFTLYRLTIQNSPNFHVVVSKVAGVTVWGVKLLSPSRVYTQPGYACPAGTTPPASYPATSPTLADYSGPATCFTPDTVKNTDGFDPGGSTSVVMAYSWVSVGDDDVAIKASDAGYPAADLTFSHDHFFYGHGMSIGSETNGTVRNVRVEDLTMDGYDSPNQNGLRIKSDATRGGLVTNVVYERICMRNVKRPILLDAFYASAPSGTLYPQFTSIVLRSFHSLGSATYHAGELTFAGYPAYPHQITFDGVFLDGGTPTYATAHYGGADSPSNTHFVFGPGPVSFAGALAGYDGSAGVTVTGVPDNTGAAYDCTGRFPAPGVGLPTSPF
jgi:polygalacturonase